MKLTGPVVVLAALFTGAPFGLNKLRSIPQPPPLLNVLAKSLHVSYMLSMLSSTCGNT